MAATKTMFQHVLDGGRMMASKTVECGVMSVSGEGDGVEEQVELRRPSASTLKVIQSMEQSGCENGNLSGGLGEAHEVLMTVNAGKKFNRVLIMYTDGETSLSDGEMSSLKRDFVDNDILFYLLVFCDQSRDDLNPAVSDNIAQFQKFTESVQGSMAIVNDLQGAMKFLSSGPGLGSRPMQSKILFEMSPSLKLSCVYCTKTMKVPLPSLKKQSNLSYDEDIPDSGKVSTNYIYRNPNDPDEELEFEERVKGYRYGPQYIPMAGLDENILKLVSEPVLRLLGFVPAESIARHHFLASSFVLGVAAGDSNDGARRAIGALGQALQNLKQVALCRLVKRANADPWLVVLLPNPDGTLLMHRLPCSEDIRNFMFPPLTSMTNVTSLQQQAVAAAIDNMTVAKLRPEDLLMVNPSSMAFLSKLQENAQTTSGPLAGIEGYENTFKTLGDHPAAVKVWREVKKLFPLAPTDQSSRDKKKRKHYWSDFDIVSNTAEAKSDNKSDIKSEDLGDASNRKQIKTESEHDIPAVLSEGSVNPVEDFESIVTSYLSAKQSNTTNLMRVQESVMSSLNILESIIEQLVLAGGTGAHYRKAVSCLQKYRQTCLLDFGLSSAEITDRFNTYLKGNIKGTFKGGRHNAFWNNVVSAGISLIHIGESSGGGVSTQDSEEFLLEKKEAVVAVVEEVKPKEEEDDDLFGDMA